ncbi:MAG: MarR family transcriptional regulator [Desulfobacterales bacterium]|jgi:DNA-binding MarR family transcriptional regulator
MKNYEDCIVFLLAKAYQKAHGSLKKLLTPYGLTPIQHLILAALWEEDSQSARDIGKKLVLDAATLSGVLDRLAAGGWIVKEADPNDKRVLRIHLTQKGRDHRSGLIQERDQANQELLAGLTVEERILLKRLLRDIKA